MGLIGLPGEWAILLNFVAWLVIQAGAGVLAWRLPDAAFAADGPLYRARRWEGSGRLYRHWLGVDRWKRFLPDAAPWLPGGFAKARLGGTTPGYLNRFIVETRRAELTHWLALAGLPVFCLWNDWWIVCLLALYALAANVPCLITQRYNRLRLQRLLTRKSSQIAGLRAVPGPG